MGTNTTSGGAEPAAPGLLQGSEREKSRQPSVHDKIREKMKEGIELTPEERELLRQKRRERRKREKELKKKEKENKVIQDIYKPRTTKLNIISGDLLSKCRDESSAGQSRRQENKIKFLDEEYPDLAARRKKGRPQVEILQTEIRDEAGRLLTSAKESNSEWETEEEDKELSGDFQQLDLKSEQMEVKVEVVEEDNRQNFSYSSILKSSKKPGQKIIKLPEQTLETPEGPSGSKKVKKKDPILFDITSALMVNKQRSKRVAGLVTGKLKKTNSKPVRNQLDSTAPERKRGKEREGGKKKRKTLMKKIILADRERRREERLRSGETLKPLPLPPDEDILSTQEIHNTSDLKPIDEKQKILTKEIDAEVMEKFMESSSNKNVKIETPDADCKIFEGSEENKALDGETEKIEIQENDTSVETKGQRRKIVAHTETEAEVVAKFVESSVEEKAKMNLHTRRFRTYCDHLLSPDLDNTVAALMSDLIRFQDKVHVKDPDKARAKRRYIVGLRECAKFLKVKKLSCIIFAPNIEKVEAEGGLDDTVSRLITEAAELNVSVVFSLNRYKLGKLCYKKVAISCIGILNFQGSDVSRNKYQEVSKYIEIVL